MSYNLCFINFLFDDLFIFALSDFDCNKFVFKVKFGIEFFIFCQFLLEEKEFFIKLI